MLVLSEEKYHLDNYGYNYRHWEETMACGEHKHQYYEYIFVVSGTCVNAMNGVTQYLEPNMLSIVRPNDYHSVGALNGQRFEYYNVMVSIREMENVLQFISGNGLQSSLERHAVLPVLSLSSGEAADFKKNIDAVTNWSVYNPNFKAQSRLLLSYVFYKYQNSQSKMSNLLLPKWLNKTLHEMQQKENFTIGLPAMMRISEKTHEYLCRSFRKYLGYSPTDFITEIRLKHAKYQLLNTNLPVIDIILDSGFNNISHFNHIFKNQNGCSPSIFRLNNRSYHVDVDLQQ